MSTYVAVDVDGTLTRSNVSFAFGRFLYSKGRISFCQAFMPTLYYAAHLMGLISVESLHRRIFGTLFLGREKRQIEEDVGLFLDRWWSALIRKPVQEELSSLRDHGARIALLSSSPDFLVRMVAARLSISEWYATEYLVDDQGRFSAIGRVVTGSVKAQIVREVKKNGPIVIMAMTDSILDGPLLEEAQVVVAVVPDRKLARLAKERGWRVVNGR